MTDKEQIQEKHIEAKLMLPDLMGNHVEEHLPGDFSSFSQAVRDKYAAWRGRFGFNLYYWQLRWLFPMKDRKIYDLNFMLHVKKAHNDKPEQLVERLHYYLARLRYGKELDFVIAIDELEWTSDDAQDAYLQKDPYVQAYKKKWLDNFDETPEWRLLYHGIHLLETDLAFLSIDDKAARRLRVIQEAEKTSKD